jgi:hypothetical protein
MLQANGLLFAAVEILQVGNMDKQHLQRGITEVWADNNLLSLDELSAHSRKLQKLAAPPYSVFTTLQVAILVHFIPI